jgi:hypothetical protein
VAGADEEAAVDVVEVAGAALLEAVLLEVVELFEPPQPTARMPAARIVSAVVLRMPGSLRMANLQLVGDYAREYSGRV